MGPHPLFSLSLDLRTTHLEKVPATRADPFLGEGRTTDSKSPIYRTSLRLSPYSRGTWINGGCPLNGSSRSPRREVKGRHEAWRPRSGGAAQRWWGICCRPPSAKQENKSGWSHGPVMAIFTSRASHINICAQYGCLTAVLLFLFLTASISTAPISTAGKRLCAVP